MLEFPSKGLVSRLSSPACLQSLPGLHLLFRWLQMPHICFLLSGIQTCISKCFLDIIIRMFDLYLETKPSLSTPNMFFLQSSHLSKLSHHSPNCSFWNLGVIFYSFLSLMSCIQSNNGPVKLRLQNIPSTWPFFTTSITATFIQVPITSHLGHRIIS